MKNTQIFLKTFFTTTLSCLLFILIFVTWVDPLKIFNYPWSSDFISDRNSSFIKLQRLKEHPGFTDLIVGSSTSEMMIPDYAKTKYQKDVFLAGDGGAPTALRMLYIYAALKYQPNLKQIIYVADLFEFHEPTIENQVYYQPEMIQLLPKEILGQNILPTFSSHIYDFLSQKTIRLSLKTLKDIKNQKKGIYQSVYKTDGTTEKSMLDYKSNTPLESRISISINMYRSIYGVMENLDPKTFFMYQRLKELLEQNDIQGVLVIPPWHPTFYQAFQATLEAKQIYSQWVQFLKSLESPNIRVLDFSKGSPLTSQIPSTEKYWHDGVHFSKYASELIWDQIYSE